MSKTSASGHAESELLQAMNPVVFAVQQLSDNSLHSNRGFYVSKEDMEKLRGSVKVWQEMLSIYYSLCEEEWDNEAP